jgi:hypothetical protein
VPTVELLTAVFSTLQTSQIPAFEDVEMRNRGECAVHFLFTATSMTKTEEPGGCIERASARMRWMSAMITDAPAAVRTQGFLANAAGSAGHLNPSKRKGMVMNLRFTTHEECLG